MTLAPHPSTASLAGLPVDLMALTVEEESPLNGFPTDPVGDGFSDARSLVIGRAHRLARARYVLPKEHSVEALMDWLWQGWEVVATVPYERGVATARRWPATGEIVAYLCSDLTLQDSQPDGHAPWEITRDDDFDSDTYLFLAYQTPSGTDPVELLGEFALRYGAEDPVEAGGGACALGSALAVLAIPDIDRAAAELLLGLSDPEFSTALLNADVIDAKRVIAETVNSFFTGVSHSVYTGKCPLCVAVNAQYTTDRHGDEQLNPALVDRIYEEWWSTEDACLRPGWDSALRALLFENVHEAWGSAAHRMRTTHAASGDPDTPMPYLTLLDLRSVDAVEPLLAVWDRWDGDGKTPKQAFAEAVALTGDSSAGPVEVVAMTTGKSRSARGSSATPMLLAALRSGDGRLWFTYMKTASSTWDGNEWDTCDRCAALFKGLAQLQPLAVDDLTPQAHHVAGTAPKSLWDRFAKTVADALDLPTTR